MSNQRILFIARTQSVSAIFAQLKEAGFEASLTDSLQGALSSIQKYQPLLVFSEARLPGYRVEDLLQKVGDLKVDIPEIIVFTEQGSASEAKQIMEKGAKDYWLAPLEWEKIKAVLPRKREKSVPKEGKKPSVATKSILGEHPLMQKALKLARQVAPSKATILISGESGTGKELFARYIHEYSKRGGKPFVAINCAALPEHLLESELFGHEKGAFTGAISRKQGKFELADGGTILLDEISEMDMALQAKLLRVLQEGEIDRVGGMEAIRVDVRVLATTNRILDEYVQEGKFRQDLFYRLNVIPVKLPPLRERGEDVMLLAKHFVSSFSRAYGVPKPSFSSRAQKWLKDYDWPGNVRELQNLMERAVLLAGEGPIHTSHFLLEEVQEEDIFEAENSLAQEQEELEETQAEAPLVPLYEMEKQMIMKSLDHTEGNRTKAAELLGISVRTLRNKLNEYRKQGLEIE
jgi:DNA-binding NtrC family response regulator